MNESIASLAFGETVGDDGIWVEYLNPIQGLGLRPTIFLDRDGVILTETNYLHLVEDVELIDGASDTIRRANKLGIPVVVVTNQSGIGRGLFGWSEFAAVQDKLIDDLADLDAYINAVLACPFHQDGKQPWNVADHPCRKPRPGMFVRAGQILPIDYKKSWIIGDHERDLKAGKAISLKGGLHVLSGKEDGPDQRAKSRNLADANFMVLEGDSIAAAIERLPIFY